MSWTLGGYDPAIVPIFTAEGSRCAMSVDTIAPPDTPVAILDRLERAAQCLETPCGDGTMLWHSWGRGPALVLLNRQTAGRPFPSWGTAS